MASALDRFVVVVNTITTLTLLSFNRLAQEANRHNTQLNKCIAHRFGGGIPRVPHTNAIYSRKGDNDADDNRSTVGADGGAGEEGCVMHSSLVVSVGIAELDEIAFLVCDDTASVQFKVRALTVLSKVIRSICYTLMMVALVVSIVYRMSDQCVLLLVSVYCSNLSALGFKFDAYLYQERNESLIRMQRNEGFVATLVHLDIKRGSTVSSPRPSSVQPLVRGESYDEQHTRQ